MPYFICPNCKERSIDTDGLESLLEDEPVGCHRCGFGFLFELMDDYYPAPTTGFVVCDQEGRVLAAGRGVFELSGYREGDLMGEEVVEALHLSGFADGKNPVAVALEWGVRQLDRELELQTASGARRRVKADLFPAYDDDGGLLVALTPR